MHDTHRINSYDRGRTLALALMAGSFVALAGVTGYLMAPGVHPAGAAPIQPVVVAGSGSGATEPAPMFGWQP